MQASKCQSRVGEIAIWYWQPDSCNLRTFNAITFDHMMANKTLLIVGDSLGAQQYESLKRLLEPVIRTLDPEGAKKGPLYRKDEEGFQLLSNGSIIFAHHLYLVGDDADTKWDQQSNSFEHVRWSVHARHADYVVFNTGQHWCKLDAEFVLYTAMVDTVLEHIAKQHKCPFFMFRTTNRGHVVPDQFLRPLSSPEDYEPGLHPHFDQWKQIQQREEVWETLIQRHGLSRRVKVLNVSFTDARGDAHVNNRLVALDQLEAFPEVRPSYSDQLHYCLPGVPDYWNWLVFHNVSAVSKKGAELDSI
jgi:hypothetical protein